MATGDIKKTVEILFGVNDQTRTGLDSIKSNFDQLDTAIQGAAAPVADLTAKLLKAEVAVIATGAAITGLAVATAGDFQTSVAEVGTLLNLTTEQNAAFSQSLIDYGRNSSVALNDIVAASYIAISTGTDLGDITLALAAAEQLAVAGATNLETATGALSRTMNAYGLEASESERVSNALFIAVQNGDTTMDALASAIGRVASSASASNVPVETLLSAIAGITVAGINTNETITGLAALFKELADPSAELSAALGGMSLETNTLQEIMQRLNLVTGGTLEGFVALGLTQEAIRVALPLSTDAMNVFANTLKAMETDTQNLAQAYEIMAGTFDRVNQNLINNLRATLIEAGTPLLDEYADSVSALSAVFKALSDGLEAPNFQVVYGALEAFINEFNKLLNGIATALPDAMAQVDFTGVTAAFTDLKTEVGGVFDSLFGDGLDLTKPEDLALVLQKVVNGITALTDITAGVIQSFGPIFDSVGELLNQFTGLTDEQQKFAGELGGSALLLTEFGTILGGIAITIRETGANIQDVGNIITGGLGVVFNTLQLLFDAYIRYSAEAVSLLADVLSNLPDFLGGDKFAIEAEEFRLISEAAAANFDQNMDDFIASAERMNSGINGEARAAADALQQIPDASADAAYQVDQDGNLINGALVDIEKNAKAAGVSVSDYLIALAKSGDVTADVALSAEQVATALADTADGAAAAVDGLADVKDAGVAYKIVVDELGNRTLVANDAMQTFKQGVAAVAGETTTTESKLSDLQKTMLQLASDERIAAMKFTAEINVAEIEAQAKQVVAAFESVASAVESTAQATVDLYSLYADSADLSFTQQWDIRDAAEKQLELQEQALLTQAKLVDAQVKLMNAQARAISDGLAEITITANGLEPELEAFMFKILDRVKIKATAEYASFLTGGG